MLRFNANLFRLAFTCASGEESRYYLRGVFVEPHAQSGVTLTATDGHRLICIRDEHGHADESAIIKLGDALKQCKAKPGRTRSIVIKTDEDSALIYEEVDNTSGSFSIATAYNVRLDGTFPDYRRVVPKAFSDKGAPGFAGRLLSSFGEIADDLALHMGLKANKRSNDCYSPVRILAQDCDKPEGAPALVQFARCDFAFGILMPVRIADDVKPAVPGWFRARAPKTQAAE
jgi:hypothetical protein